MLDNESKPGRSQPAPVMFVAPEPQTASARESDRDKDPDRSEPAERRTEGTKTRKRSRSKTKTEAEPAAAASPAEPAAEERAGEERAGGAEPAKTRKRTRRKVDAAAEPAEAEPSADTADGPDDIEDVDDLGHRRRRRGRRGRGRGRGADAENGDQDDDDATGTSGGGDDRSDAPEATETVTRRRRRRRTRADSADTLDTAATDTDPANGEVVVKIRRSRKADQDAVRGVSGSTRLEAKRQRRRDGRGQRRTRPQVLSESEFLARRESVKRTMVIRGRGERTQIGVLEDDLLVEHYVTRSGGQGMAGNVYLGKVQNVLPSMEAAFVDIGKGRNAVLYAGEVNWDRTGLAGRTRTIEQAMKPGDAVLVQVTKDPVGHKGARLTSHIALSGRHLVYVPHGNSSGISRKLPEGERARLRSVLKKLVPEGAGVIVRTAAEGAGADDLAGDVSRLQAEWERIRAKADKGGAPVLLYQEPDLVVRVVRDVFNEDFTELVVDGESAYAEVREYVEAVSPDLLPRLKRYTGAGDVFAEMRVDEQLLKALDRKVYLPSGGSLVVDRTEAMTVIDVNTGRFTGEGGNLEETVTRNNLEAAEEIVRQLRLRDVGGIIVIDFIDMVLESNRDLVLRRLTECLGRDRTKHQVTEITSLGLVQMTRKRVGQGLLEAFSEPCEHCRGRGVIVHTGPVDKGGKSGRNGHKEEPPPTKKSKGGKKKDGGSKKDNSEAGNGVTKSAAEPTRKIAEASASTNGTPVDIEAA